MAHFKIGDSVETIDDVIKGIVESINGDDITIISEDGFPLMYKVNELVLILDDIHVSNIEIAQVKKEKELPKRNKNVVPKIKERNAPKMEVDLHINQLMKNPKEIGKFEMLNLQLDTAKRQLDFAISKRIQKIVFIHGVGEGVLKEELGYMLRKYDNVKFYDADYQKYGLGATEVYVFQN
ncbi:Smr/MutS family protein [Maribacter hydrothermalis]|uniref:DNA mismatch repair protein MutS n=1 Tax=Maribacter hydrothermalis TaxID=1836467 RepID=A0A1B7ZDV4_9FLAO|nr:Smr/MutS family protein [Maribacter hydrothermalis]APQ18400.1 DNA mismatch repair protein MutS [Maribacter hydrothermalis]OBR41393.1 DNA mismatch repair protein MutS [Maribacter hydrothermalis]